MSSKPSISLLAYIFTILLISGTCFADLHVAIFNTLPGNTPPLGLHCKSGDDDLGHQSLGVGGMYTWSFLPNFWGTTLFWCNFWWDGKHAGFHVYDINYIPDVVYGVSNFVYEARLDGFYFYAPDRFTHDTYQWELVKKWEY
ncbi:S-protein-like [Heracleum sosnowskyi]|uniref:S-protein homolog n=1 Tax=Heracleum sosnowskyi TaxID=360622 RepID=A0AAD8J0D9_9APIA|nr:S-protein-like [Heracleum sosnowskyi]